MRHRLRLYGYDPMPGRYEIEGFRVRTFDDEKMDRVIVAMAHEKFRRM
ncbi:MAG: hypothetical protein KAW93_10225 [Methanogenium sp.]|nr:hypothetical protein [Methanogenium sp.]